MANEAEIISNPTSVPSAVSESYARQNTRAYAATNGMDSTYMAVTGDIGGAVPVRAVDVNGTLYAVKSQVNFTVNMPGARYIHLVGTGNQLTPTLSTDAGTWSAAKNARYNSNGERVLNWVIGYGSNGGLRLQPLVEGGLGYNTFNDEPFITESFTLGTTWEAPVSKYYIIEIQARGGDGGTAVGAYLKSAIGGDGGGGCFVRKRIFIPAGTIVTMVKSTASGGYWSAAVGAPVNVTISAQNGFAGESVSALVGGDGVTGAHGAGGTGHTNADFFYVGLAGGETETSRTNGLSYSSFGSVHRITGVPPAGSSNGVNGFDYGGGGAGGVRSASSGGGGTFTATGGSGGSGFIRFIG